MRRKFDPANNVKDMNVVLLASCGLENATIMKLTGLSLGQVQYRIEMERKRSGEEQNLRKSFRQGNSKVAKMVINMLTGKTSQASVLRQNVVNRMIDSGLYIVSKSKGRKVA